MTYTYTRTMTDEEQTIEDLNESIYAKIMSEVLNGNNESYMKPLPDGNASNEPQRNIVEAGVFIGNGYRINKYHGVVEWPGSDIHFEYVDGEGKIVSCGEEYEKATVQLKDQEEVGFFDFSEHPEIEEYLDKIKRKFELKDFLKNSQSSVRK